MSHAASVALSSSPGNPVGDNHRCTVIGIGLRAHAQPAALHALWAQAQAGLAAGARFGTSRPQICAVAVLDTKAAHPALAAWLSGMAGDAGAVPIVSIPAARMADHPVTTQSARLLARYGTGSVAEAAALSAAGLQAELAMPRLVAGDGSATLAVAIRRAGYPACCMAVATLTSAPLSPELPGASA